jgi:predicted nucleotide-binding protein
MNLRAFVGSSSESLNVANAIKHALEHEIDCTVWTESFFKLSQTTIETLSTEVDKFDVGIFVFGADDMLSSRGADFSVPRDNVVFEHGLFCGCLGPQRTFVLRPKSKTLKWLSDLEGFTPAEYDSDLAKTNADEAVKPACQQVLQQLRSLVPRPGIFVEGRWMPLGYDLWTYACSEPSRTTSGAEKPAKPNCRRYGAPWDLS